MQPVSPMAIISKLSAPTCGVFRGTAAVSRGVRRTQLARLKTAGVIERLLPDTYRITAVARSSLQSLHAALLWAGDDAAAAGHSAAELYGLEGIRAEVCVGRDDRSVFAQGTIGFERRLVEVERVEDVVSGYRGDAHAVTEAGGDLHDPPRGSEERLCHRHTERAPRRCR